MMCLGCSRKKNKRCVWVKNFKRCVLLRTIFFNTKAVRERERSRESVRERLGKSRCATDFLMSDHEDFGFVDTNVGREGRFLGLIRVCQSDLQAQAGFL
ncbi:hypothetical protein RGQ29_030898 [Quercus rubra]|uniref:Uncharacterized protein n=1 Tax=Quercus rubra TaxID=3512 RepID=A0AAN7IB74_QUERU|nr:hypothetical protein RGQ29_030898 [Quercus rubra]